MEAVPVEDMEDQMTPLPTGQGHNNTNCQSNVKKTKDLARAASVRVVDASKVLKSKGTKYTIFSVNHLATALPDPEIMILAIILVTLFLRAEEAHLKRFCDNDGSVGWIMTAIGCCIVGFSKFNDTKSSIMAIASSIIYFLIQCSLNYPPMGCLFTDVVVGSLQGEDQVVSYSDKTRTFAGFQAIVLVIFGIVYTVVNYRKRIAVAESDI